MTLLKELPVGTKYHFYHRDGSHYVVMDEYKNHGHKIKTCGATSSKGNEIWLGDGSQEVEKIGDYWYEVGGKTNAYRCEKDCCKPLIRRHG